MAFGVTEGYLKQKLFPAIHRSVDVLRRELRLPAHFQQRSFTHRLDTPVHYRQAMGAPAMRFLVFSVHRSIQKSEFCVPLQALPPMACDDPKQDPVGRRVEIEGVSLHDLKTKAQSVSPDLSIARNILLS